MYNAVWGADAHIGPAECTSETKKRCGEIEGSQWAGVGIGPYNVRKEVQRIWEV